MLTEVQRLRADLEHALDTGAMPAEVVPRLERFRLLVADGTSAAVWADRLLAECLLEARPWRAAIHARRVIDVEDDAAAWALMGLAQLLLGHDQFAAQAFRAALKRDPGNVSYAHNLGHVLDVALNRPDLAIPYLELATRGSKPVDVAVVCSLAHAHLKLGQFACVEQLLGPFAQDDEARVLLGEMARQQCLPKLAMAQRKSAHRTRRTAKSSSLV